MSQVIRKQLLSILETMENAHGYLLKLYGDNSSVVQLYQKTGKPIMIQNVGILYNE